MYFVSVDHHGNELFETVWYVDTIPWGKLIVHVSVDAWEWMVVVKYVTRYNM